jgi:predicted phage gp36 major capsid-like protein
MTTSPSWRELYRAALLEVEHEELRRRIDEAEKAVYQRSEELKRSGNCSGEERQAMTDAIRALHLLAQTECRGSTGTGKPQMEVAS